jgi:hypothetical protein
MRLAEVWLAALAGAFAQGAADAPAWVVEASGRTTPRYDQRITAVVLISEQRVDIDDSGKRTITTRSALRVLSREGASHARATEVYRTGSSKVKEFRAWLVSPSGQVLALGKDRVMDVAAVQNDIYSDIRARAVSADQQATPGSVFAYEAVSEDKSIFTQFEWEFQEHLPVLASRFTIAMPAGWRAESVTFNAPKIEPVVTGATYQWQMNDLPPIEREPLGPETHTLAPRIGVTFFPPSAVKNAGPSFASWKDVSIFQSALADDRQTTSPEMISKTVELTASAANEFEKIAAIGRYVQTVNYIAIATGVGRGGGYRPHAATDVFPKSYGDCKDKANLMRTMLKIAGIESYLVAIYSGDRTYARAEWPSPHQFNHMIAAVRVSDAVKAAAVLSHPQLGRLLMFDPTDDSIPLGYLPRHEQGSNALVLAGERGALVTVPATPPDDNRIEREANMSIGLNGVATINLIERSFGETAAALRYQRARSSPEEYRRHVEHWLSRTGATPAITRLEEAQAGSGLSYERKIDFSSPNVAETMQGRLLMVKPVPAPFSAATFAEAKRKYPVLLEAQMQSEQVRVTPPEGFQVDETPDPVKLETPYATYNATYTVEGGAVTVKRRLEVRASTVAVENYGQLRTFFGQVHGNVIAPIVFVKK